MTEKRRPALVIGYGNPLRSDDGFGWRVARELEDGVCSDQMDVMACHQLTPELAEEISTRGLVVFVDVEVGRRVGEISRRRVEPEPPEAAVFGHTLEPAGLLALAKELYGSQPEAQLVSTGSETLEFGERLSPSVEAAVGTAVEEIRRLVAACGHSSLPQSSLVERESPPRD